MKHKTQYIEIGDFVLRIEIYHKYSKSSQKDVGRYFD